MEIFVQNNKKGILPSQLAKSVSFNRKLGSAFFRDGITPNNEHPSNVLGGYFQLLLMGTKGNKELLEKFDKIFIKIFKMTANELEKGKQLANAINGIFIRCEINPDKETYNDLSNLPFLIKIQIWIGHNWHQATVKKELIDKIEHELLDQMEEFPKEMCSEFQYHLADQQRIRLWLYECRDRPKHRKCPGDECQICFEMSKHFDGKDYRIESSEHWKDYIKEDQLFQSPNMMSEIEKNKEKIMPSFLAKEIFFNRKLGAALFRNGIEPSYEHPLNEDGGFYRFVFLGTTENEELLAKFDQIFHILIGQIANSPNKDSINGIFVRCECRPDAFKNAVGSNSITNLPFLIKMEVWIGNHFEYNDKIKLPLIEKFVEKLKKMDSPKPFYKFYMLNMNI